MVDKRDLQEKMVDILEFMVDKDEFITEQIVSHFGYRSYNNNLSEVSDRLRRGLINSIEAYCCFFCGAA